MLPLAPAGRDAPRAERPVGEKHDEPCFTVSKIVQLSGIRGDSRGPMFSPRPWNDGIVEC
jgi:hypothetical protein